MATSLVQVLRVLDALAAAGIECWLEGGWGVDALVGRQTREHRDVDVDLPQEQEATALEALAALGYRIDEDRRPNRVELRAADGSRVDVHPLAIDDDGVRQAGEQGEWYVFPADCFTTGALDGRPVPCFTSGAQRFFHTGYDLRPQDRADLAQLDAVETRRATGR